MGRMVWVWQGALSGTRNLIYLTLNIIFQSRVHRPPSLDRNVGRRDQIMPENDNYWLSCFTAALTPIIVLLWRGVWGCEGGTLLIIKYYGPLLLKTFSNNWQVCLSLSLPFKFSLIFVRFISWLLAVISVTRSLSELVNCTTAPPTCTRWQTHSLSVNVASNSLIVMSGLRFGDISETTNSSYDYTKSIPYLEIFIGKLYLHLRC